MARRPLHLGYWAQPQKGPRAEFLAETNRPEVDDGGEIEGVEFAVAAAGVVDLAHGFGLLF